MRSLGLDIGDRRIGVAISDPRGVLATPLTVIVRSEDMVDIGAIIDTLRKEQVEKIIVGLPRSMAGGLGQQSDKVLVFVEHLKKHTQVPVEFRDERLTTVLAKRLMADANMKKARRKGGDDAFAAAVILQGYLDETRGD